MINGRLLLEAKVFSDHFAECYKIYKDWYSDKGRTNYTRANICRAKRRLIENYDTFLRELRDCLDDPNGETPEEILRVLRATMNPVMFDNDLLRTDYAGISSFMFDCIRDTNAARTGFDLCRDLYFCLRWYNADDKCGLNVNTISAILSGESESNNVNPADFVPGDNHTPAANGAVKNPLTVDGIKWLFLSLRQKHVIDYNLPDTELSDMIARMTRRSATQLRKNDPPTKAGKDKLKKILQELIRDLDE